MHTDSAKYSYAFLEAKINDAIRLSKERQTPFFTSFLTQEEQAAVKNICRQAGFKAYLFYGGYPASERAVFAAFPRAPEEAKVSFPITSLVFAYKQTYNLSHRDFLGALMGTGIKREAVGDILTEPGRAVAFVKEELASYIQAQIKKIGSVGVIVSAAESIAVLPAVKKPEEKLYTVASLRLDNIVSAVTGLSREKSAKLIMTGLVSVNHQNKDSVSLQLKQGDTLTVKGHGKCIIGENEGLTKKGRIKLVIKQYR